MIAISIALHHAWVIKVENNTFHELVRLMPIVMKLDLMLAKRKKTSRELAQAIGLSETNLSLIKSGKIKGVRFTTLDAICEFLDCEPGDIIGREIPESNE